MNRNLFLLVASLLWVTMCRPQCTTYSAINQLPVSCSSDSIFFSGAATSSCTYGGTYDYTWRAFSISNGSGMEEVIALTSGTSISGSLIPVFALPAAMNSLHHVCLEVVYNDTSGQALDTALQCDYDVSFPQPLSVSGFVSNNSCGNPSCLAQFSVSGGSAPYTFLLSNGAVISPGSVTCFEVSSTYVLTAIDANGCSGDFTFTIDLSDDDNSTCQNAIPVEVNNPLLDTLCSLAFDSANCGSFNYYQQGWYHFNSGDYSHISIGADIGYGGASGSAYPEPFVLEVYENADASPCGGNLVHCHLSDSSGGCFALDDFIEILSNTTYTVHVLAQWTSWVPMSLWIAGDTAIQDVICGCTNASSCNFDPTALVDDGSCGYNGCTDAGACNFMSYATCDDGSCLYGQNLSASVFHDLNGDGVLQEYNPGEPFIGGSGYFTLNETGQHIYPSSSGQIWIPDLSPGMYTLSYTDTTDTWILPGGVTTVQLPACYTVPVGLIPASGAVTQINAYGTFWGQSIHCIGGFSPGISIVNSGISMVSGSLTLAFDTSLSFGFSGGEAFTEVAPGVLQWEINDLPAGASAWYEVHFDGPGAALAGQQFPFTMSLQLLDSEGNGFYNHSWDFTGWVTCSYDPNDKSAYPAGYTDAHFIASDQVLEYRIRFQNTGNASAYNVRIEDYIDVAHLDLATFQPLGASHDYSVVSDPSGLIQFFFNDIMLPDSLTDEPNSHGWLQYRIAPLSGMDVGEVISNEAAIYFDDNVPVMTNEVSHTVYDCSIMEPLADEVITCIANPVILSVDTSFTYNYLWYENNLQISTGPEFNYAFPDTGAHLLILERENPICSRRDTVLVQSTPFPSTDLWVVGDSVFASDGAYWEWFLNDDPLVDSVQFIVADEPGVYYAFVYSAEGCMSISEVYAALGIEQKFSQRLMAYPNPAQDFLWLDELNSGDYLELYDAFGQRVWSAMAAGKTQRIDLSSIPSGMYMVRLMRDDSENVSLKVIVKK